MLDRGAEGVVVPHVDDANGAAAAVAASRYAPRGRRGMCQSCHGGGCSLKDWRTARGSSKVHRLFGIMRWIFQERKAVHLDRIVERQSIVSLGPAVADVRVAIDHQHAHAERAEKGCRG